MNYRKNLFYIIPLFFVTMGFVMVYHLVNDPVEKFTNGIRGQILGILYVAGCFLAAYKCMMYAKDID